MKILTLFFTFASGITFAQFFDPGGIIHFYGGSQAILTKQHPAEVSAYKANFDKGYSTHNYTLGFGVSAYKRNGIDLQLRTSLMHRNTTMLDYTSMPYFNEGQIINHFDHRILNNQISFEFQGFKEVYAQRNWTHWAGLNLAYRNGFQYDVTTNNAYHFQKKSFLSDEISNYQTMFQYYPISPWEQLTFGGFSGAFGGYGILYSDIGVNGIDPQIPFVEVTRFSMLTLQLKYAVQVKIGSEFFPRFELGIGNSFSKKYPYANRWFVEASLGFSLLQDYQSIKRMRAARKAKKRAKS